MRRFRPSTRVITETMTEHEQKALQIKALEEKQRVDLLTQLANEFNAFKVITSRPDPNISQELKHLLENPDNLPAKESKNLANADLERLIKLLEERFEDEKESPVQEGYNRDTILKHIREMYALISKLPGERAYDVYRDRFRSGCEILLNIEENMAKMRRGENLLEYASGATPEEAKRLKTVVDLFDSHYSAMLKEVKEKNNQAQEIKQVAGTRLQIINDMRDLVTIRQLCRLNEILEILKSNPSNVLELEREAKQLQPTRQVALNKRWFRESENAQEQSVRLNEKAKQIATNLAEHKKYAIEKAKQTRQYVRYWENELAAHNYKLNNLNRELKGEIPPTFSEEELISRKAGCISSIVSCENQKKSEEKRAMKYEEGIQNLNNLYHQLGLTESVKIIELTNDAKELANKSNQLNSDRITLFAEMKEYDEKLLLLTQNQKEYDEKLKTSAGQALQQRKELLTIEWKKIEELGVQLRTKEKNLNESKKVIDAEAKEMLQHISTLDQRLCQDLGVSLSDLRLELINARRLLTNEVPSMLEIKTEPMEVDLERKAKELQDAVSVFQNQTTEYKVIAGEVERKENEANAYADKLQAEAKNLEKEKNKEMKNIIKHELKLEQQDRQLIQKKLKLTDDEMKGDISYLDDEAKTYTHGYFIEGLKLYTSREFNFTPNRVFAENQLSFFESHLAEIRGVSTQVTEKQYRDYKQHIDYFCQSAEAHFVLLHNALNEKDLNVRSKIYANLLLEFTLREQILNNPLFFEFRHSLMGLPFSPTGGGLVPLQSCLEREKAHTAQILQVLKKVEHLFKTEEVKGSINETKNEKHSKFMTTKEIELQQARRNAIEELQMIRQEKDRLDANQAIAWAAKVLSYLDMPQNRTFANPEIRECYLQVLQIAMNRAMTVPASFNADAKRIDDAKQCLQDVVGAESYVPIILCDEKEPILEEGRAYFAAHYNELKLSIKSDTAAGEVIKSIIIPSKELTEPLIIPLKSEQITRLLPHILKYTSDEGMTKNPDFSLSQIEEKLRYVENCLTVRNSIMMISPVTDEEKFYQTLNIEYGFYDKAKEKLLSLFAEKIHKLDFASLSDLDQRLNDVQERLQVIKNRIEAKAKRLEELSISMGATKMRGPKGDVEKRLEARAQREMQTYQSLIDHLSAKRVELSNATLDTTRNSPTTVVSSRPKRLGG